MPEPSILAVSVTIALLASVLQGITGFGYNIIVIPLLALYLEPAHAVVAVMVNNVVLNSLMLAFFWRAVCVGRIWLLTLAGVVATPAGALALRAVDPGAARIAIGVVVMGTGLAMLAGFRRTIRNEAAASGLIGTAGGVLNGAVGMAGPPVILFFANQGLRPGEFRANIVAYFAVLTAVAAPSYAMTGTLTAERALFGLLLTPALVVGVLAGVALHRRVPEQAFRRLTLGLVVLAGVVALGTGVRTL